MKKTILIIDDDTKLIDLLSHYLNQFDLEVLGATHPKEGMALLKERKPDLIVLDVMLPEKNGFELCKEIRHASNVPVIMLTARGDVTDRIVGLELGADDYLSKPFEPRELTARIQSVLRRTPATSQEKLLIFGDLQIDLELRSAKMGNEDLELTTMEFEALALFASRPGAVMNRDQIMEYLKGMDWEVFNRSIDVLISRLRQKLHDDPKNPTYFKTVWGTGYVFIGKRKEAEG